jgi:hypothetical protein
LLAGGFYEMHVGLVGVLLGHLADLDVVGGDLLLELPPLLLGPPELLYGGGEVEEMDRDDRGSRAKVGIPDEGIQLAPGFYESFVDPVEAFALLRGVAMRESAQVELLENRDGRTLLGASAYNRPAWRHKRTRASGGGSGPNAAVSCRS